MADLFSHFLYGTLVDAHYFVFVKEKEHETFFYGKNTHTNKKKILC